MLDASPYKHRRGDEEAIEALHKKETGTDQEVMELMIKEESRRFPVRGTDCGGYGYAEIPGQPYDQHFKRQ